MDDRRTKSLPPIGDGTNPFWSQRAAEEYRIRNARPSDLAASAQDVAATPSPSARRGRDEGSQEERALQRQRSRSSRAAFGTEGQYATPPSSWTFRTHEAMHGQPELRDGEISRDREEQSMQRALEKEVVGLLHEENVRLKEVERLKREERIRMELQMQVQKEFEERNKHQLELQRIKQAFDERNGKPRTPGSWSEVSGSGTMGREPPPPPMTPRTVSSWRTPETEEVRYTPNGTRIPQGPPPQESYVNLPPPPSWIPEGENQDKGVWGEKKRSITDQVFQGDRALAGHVELCSDRASISGDLCQRDRAEHGGLCEQGRAKHGERCERDRADDAVLDECGRDRVWHGWSYQPDQGGHHQHPCPSHSDPRGGNLSQDSHGGNGLTQQERSRLEREIARLQERLEQKPLQTEYWSRPVHRWDALGGSGASEERSETRSLTVGNEGNQGAVKELPELGGSVTPIALGDWLVSIGPSMKDLTPLSAMWWSETSKQAEEYYNKWRQCTPLERVQLQTMLPQLLQDPQFMRTEQRGVGLLLKAIPTEMRSVLIASRELCSTTILYRLLITYQPGGAGEKSLLLKHLTENTGGRDLAEAGTNLRTWRRYFLRAVEIQTTLPDPTLLLKALDPPSMLVSKIDSQAAFRLAQTRSQLGIDERPSQENVWQFSQCVLAEVETLQLLNGTTTATTSGASTSSSTEGQVAAKVKALELRSKGNGKGSPGGEAKSRTCHFWGSSDGCRLGAACKYLHDWEAVTDKVGRCWQCWQCSSKNHMRSACPTLKDQGQSKPSIGGSGDGKEDKGKGKGKKGGKENGEGSANKDLGNVEGEEDKSKPPLTATPNGSQPMVKEVSDPKMNGNAGTGGTSTVPTTTSNQEGLVSEVTNLLRSLRFNNEEPRMRTCVVKKLTESEEVMTLLDGGATHCLRTRKSISEWDQAVDVKVKLATGEVEMKQCPSTTTLLVQEQVQSIVPVAKLLEVGYTLRWTKDECRIEHIKHGRVPVVMIQGCPTVNAKWGEILMSEVEEAERRKARVRSILQCGVLAEDQWEKEIAALRMMFPEAPMRVLERIPGDKEVDMRQIPINRKRRKQIERAKHIIIHMFAGPDDSKWKRMESNDTVVIAVDVLSGMNIMDPQIAGWIDQLIATKKVIMWTAGPPCRTVSMCRFERDDGGPQQLRSRTGEERFGLFNLTAGQRDLTDHDSAAWLKNLRWMVMVKENNEKAELLLEQPADPAEWSEKGKSCPTFTTWPETQQVVASLKLETVKCDQGAIGHCTRKPSVFYTDMQEVGALAGMTNELKQVKWPTELQDRLVMSKSLAAWAPGLVEMVVRAGERLRRSGVQVKALSQKERAEVASWEEHFRMNHTPYRRDCLQCLEALGKDRPRKRIVSPESYCMSLDLTGPFQEGKDQEIKKCKYLMVAAVTIPMEEGIPLPKGLQEMGYKKKIQSQEEPGQQRGDEDGDEELGKEVERLEEETEDQEELTQVEVKEVETANQRWKEFIKETKEMEVRTLTWGVPLKSRSSKDILEAVSKIYGRFKALQIPIIRVHCDRAREFVGGSFKEWANSRDLMVTYSAGDEPAGNARVEREIGWVKGRTRLLLGTAKAPVSYWPLAARQALEERCRSQLNQMGIPTPALLPFGAVGVARKKTWFNRSQPWKWPRQRVRCWGPAADMSITSGGQFLETEDANFIRSTVINMPSKWSHRVEVDLEQKLQGEIEEKEVGGVGINHAPGNVEDATWDVKDTNSPTPKMAEEEDIFSEIPEEVMVIQHPQPREVLHVEKQPRRRMLKKTPPGWADKEPQQELSVRKATKRGEWTDGNTDDWAEKNEEENYNKLKMFQHMSLQQLAKEEMSYLQEGAETTGLMRQAMDEAKELEAQLMRQEIAVRSLTKEVEEEVMQTRVVAMDEVKKNLDKWKPAFEKECKTLTAGPVKPLSPQEVQEMREAGEEIEILPMLAIASRKPPDRYKGRVVVCGNFAESKPEGTISVGGICATAIRGVVHLAATKQWSLGTLDVTGAFLQAPRRPHGKTTLAQPPSILQSMGLTAQGELWRMDCALYGLQESPSDWGAHRDEKAREMKWRDTKGNQDTWKKLQNATCGKSRMMMEQREDTCWCM